MDDRAAGTVTQIEPLTNEEEMVSEHFLFKPRQESLWAHGKPVSIYLIEIGSLFMSFKGKFLLVSFVTSRCCPVWKYTTDTFIRLLKDLYPFHTTGDMHTRCLGSVAVGATSVAMGCVYSSHSSRMNSLLRLLFVIMWDSSGNKQFVGLWVCGQQGYCPYQMHPQILLKSPI
ncbi:MAG: hypothetical protein ABFS22_05870 [Pseudomonadota bacterium]